MKLNIALNMISASLSLEEDERARVELERALDIGPEERSVRRMEGVYHMTVGEPEKAVAAYAKLTDLDPSSAVGWIGLHDAYQELGDVRRARQAAVQAQRIGDERPAREDQRLRLPAAYRVPAIFALLLSLLVGVFLALRWAWFEVRNLSTAR